jgi:hypothetical protein
MTHEEWLASVTWTCPQHGRTYMNGYPCGECTGTSRFAVLILS